MSMVQSRRASNGEDDSFYDDGRKPKLLFLDERAVKTYPIYSPNKSQMLTAVHGVDERWKPSWTRRLALHPITFIVAVTVAIGLLTYAIVVGVS